MCIILCLAVLLHAQSASVHAKLVTAPIAVELEPVPKHAAAGGNGGRVGGGNTYSSGYNRGDGSGGGGDGGGGGGGDGGGV